MLLPKTSSARGPSSVPSASSSSYADRPLPGSDSGSTPQTPRDVLARGRVVDHPVAGQLVGLLPVLAATLAVALAGEAAVAGVRRPGLAEGEREVDPRQHGVGAGRVLLGAAGGQHHHLVRLAQQPGQRAQLVGGHAGDPLDPLGPPRRRGPPSPRRTRWSAPRRTPCRRCRRRPPGAAGRAPAPGRCRGPAARRRPLGPRSAYAAGPPPRPGRRARGARRGGARPAASSRPGWSRPAPARRSARGRPAGTAGPGRGRRPGCRRTRPRTCTSGRCSRSGWCPGRRGRTCRAGRPSRWSGHRRRRPRPSRCRARPAAR